MNPIVIIPARYGSSRLPGKALMHLSGKTLIEHTVEAAIQTGLQVYVATDHDGIAHAAQRAGAHPIMTGECENGTERCAEAAKTLGHLGPVVNWQGDSPLVPAIWIKDLLENLELGAEIATPIQQCSIEQAEQIRRDFAMGKIGATSVAINYRFEAMYFSKSPIPSRGPIWLHVGIYAYSSWALSSYGNCPTNLERMEGLEQLRYLETRTPVQCVSVNGPPIWEVNNFHDIAKVEKLMEERRETSRT